MPDKDKLVVWPIYFDSTRSRSEGRMVSTQEGVKEPTLDDIVTAPKVALSLRSRGEETPKTWHECGKGSNPKEGPKSGLEDVAQSLKGKG
jgi:signal recognition particle subunit SEC65